MKTVGILAHVDAGKTTFSEQVLLLSHAIRKAGRVDHQDTFLDTHPIEKSRGITIFSGLARFQLGDDTVIWLDTPGHVDFSAEMERAVSMMDYAIVVVSCAEGIQSHTETVWGLLEAYHVPVFLFLNKTDRVGADPDGVLAQLRRFSTDMVDFRAWQGFDTLPNALIEAIAERSETLLDTLLDSGYDAALWQRTLPSMIQRREIFPVLTGSALEGKGIEAFLSLLSLTTSTDYAAHV